MAKAKRKPLRVGSLVWIPGKVRHRFGATIYTVASAFWFDKNGKGLRRRKA